MYQACVVFIFDISLHMTVAQPLRLRNACVVLARSLRAVMQRFRMIDVYADSTLACIYRVIGGLGERFKGVALSSLT